MSNEIEKEKEIGKQVEETINATDKIKSIEDKCDKLSGTIKQTIQTVTEKAEEAKEKLNDFEAIKEKAEEVKDTLSDIVQKVKHGIDEALHK